ncbi:MAG: S8 family serine peptidase [Planctomycetes bacterium]|nr:S8 family serine peptidase [Planctomycetota bacterium]
MHQAIRIFILLLLALPAAAQRGVPVGYGRSGLELQREDRLIALGTRRDVDEAKLREILGEDFVVLRERLVEWKTVVFEVRAGSMDRCLERLRPLRGTRYAHPLHVIEPGIDRQGWYILTADLVAKFRGAPTVNEIQAELDRAGLELVRPLRWLPGAFQLRVRGDDDALRALASLRESERLEWAHADWLRHLGTRETLPNDPLFPNLWHLKNSGQGGGLIGSDANAGGAWDHVQGQGMVIAVIDTGVSAHPDLVLTATGYDAITGAGSNVATDPYGHGTAVAGIAAARGNNSMFLCGMAHQATIMPIRLITPSGFGTATGEAGCFVWASDNGADVITNSWGPDGVPFPLPTVVQGAFAYATSTGRGGLGTPIFWAAGNGNEAIAPDEYVSSPYTVAVGAVTNLDYRASYSDYGPELDLLASSSGGTRSINTTTNTGGTTLTFGGTSAAAPLAAGVGALILQAAPQLNWVQVRDILRASAVPIQPAVALYDATGHSNYYGHGRLDAHQAVLDALATLPQPLALSITTTGASDITIDLNNMGPFHEWAIGFSAQVYNPVGSGPLFGVGWDALITFFMPVGRVPFHSWADANGNFHWGAVGIPAGITLQAVALEVLPDYSWRISNVTSTTF